MLHSHKVVAFIATEQPERAKRFYRDVLGLRLIADEPWALVFEAGQTMLRIQKASTVVVAPYTALGWEVDDIESVIRQLADLGVEPIRFDFLPQDERGIWTAPDGARVFWFHDPDGHTLSLTAFAKP